MDPETGETIALGELLAGGQDDPSVSAARNLDWEEFLAGRDRRYPAMVSTAAKGEPMCMLKRKFKASDFAISSLKRRLAVEIREAMGEDVLEAVCRQPRWRSDIAAEHERAVCRAERRRS